MDDKQDNRRDSEEARIIRNMQKDEFSDEVLEAKWKIMKNSFQREHTHLTDQDLSYHDGEFGSMLKRIGEKTGLSDRRLRSTIYNWDDSRRYE